MLNDKVLEANLNKNQINQLTLAKILISLAVYFFTAAVLIEHFNLITVLKAIAFMLSAHGFYFLWQYQQARIL